MSGLRGACFAPPVARLRTLNAFNQGRLHGQAREGATPLIGAPNRPHGGLVRRPMGVAPSRAVSVWRQVPIAVRDLSSDLPIDFPDEHQIDLPNDLLIDLLDR
jgi:hypothetical protein